MADRTEDCTTEDNNEGTVPYQIFEAFEILQIQRERSKSNRKDATVATVDHQSTNAPIDIVAVVVDIACENTPFSSILHLQLVDPSLESNHVSKASIQLRLRVTNPCYSLSSDGSIVKLGQETNNILCSMGDIVRFNRVSLGPTHENKRNSVSDTNSSTNKQPMPMVCEFQHSWKDPEQGVEICRLARYDSSLSTFYQREVSTRIPPIHATQDSFLQNLMDWFGDSLHHRARWHPAPSLAPLPHTTRSLSELQTCVGLVADTCALRVSQVQSRLHSSVGRKKGGGSKRPRTSSYCTLAMLSDGTHQMLFLDADNRFHQLLQQAAHLSKAVKLHFVKSERSFVNGCGAEDVMLVCQTNTKMFLSNDTTAMQLSSDASSSSKPWFSMSLSQNNVSDENGESSKHIFTFTPENVPKKLHGRILELFINGSVVDMNQSIGEIEAILLSPNSEKGGELMFPEANVLLLLDQVDDQPTQGGDDCRSILCSSDFVVSKLCGGLEWADFVSQDRIRQKSVKFLVSLLANSIPLQWVVVSEGEHSNIMVAKDVLLTARTHS